MSMIQSGQPFLKRAPAPKAAAPAPVVVAGIELAPVLCPRCGARAMQKACPCFLRKHGWATCAKCLNTKCAHQFGIKKIRKRR